MVKYRRVHMPLALHQQIKSIVEKSEEYQSIDQLCREAAEKIIEEHNLVEEGTRGGKIKTRWKSANILKKDYLKIQAWIKTGRTPYVSVDEAIRGAIRAVIKDVFQEIV